MEALFLIGRIVLGVYFIMSGIDHFRDVAGKTQYATMRKLPSAKAGVIVSGAVILLGGLGVLLGVYTTWAVGTLALFLIAAAFGIHHYWTDTDPNQRAAERVNFMKNLAFAAALLMVLSVETPWAWRLF